MNLFLTLDYIDRYKKIIWWWFSHNNISDDTIICADVSIGKIDCYITSYFLYICIYLVQHYWTFECLLSPSLHVLHIRPYLNNIFQVKRLALILSVLLVVFLIISLVITYITKPSVSSSFVTGHLVKWFFNKIYVNDLPNLWNCQIILEFTDLAKS